MLTVYDIEKMLFRQNRTPVVMGKSESHIIFLSERSPEFIKLHQSSLDNENIVFAGSAKRQDFPVSIISATEL